ncbi:MAG: DNA-directed RNA polymerase subunit omega [Victivallaceae bacterium]
MNNAYLERAKKVIPDPQILSIIAAKRAKQLSMGARPMVRCTSDNQLDIALLEIAENKISYEFGGSGDAIDIFTQTTSEAEEKAE